MTAGDKPMQDAERAFSVKPDSALPRITEAEFNERAREILREAKAGRQVAIVDSDGRIKTVVGMNGVRFLPDPEPGLSEDGRQEWGASKENRVNPWVD